MKNWTVQMKLSVAFDLLEKQLPNLQLLSKQEKVVTDLCWAPYYLAHRLRLTIRLLCTPAIYSNLILYFIAITSSLQTTLCKVSITIEHTVIIVSLISVTGHELTYTCQKLSLCMTLKCCKLHVIRAGCDKTCLVTVYGMYKSGHLIVRFYSEYAGNFKKNRSRCHYVL